MELLELAKMISPSALPLVVTILGGLFIYFKIGNDRKDTKVKRDDFEAKTNERLALLEQKTDEISEMRNDIKAIQATLNQILGRLDIK